MTHDILLTFAGPAVLYLASMFVLWISAAVMWFVTEGEDVDQSRDRVALGLIVRVPVVAILGIAAIVVWCSA